MHRMEVVIHSRWQQAQRREAARYTVRGGGSFRRLRMRRAGRWDSWSTPSTARWFCRQHGPQTGPSNLSTGFIGLEHCRHVGIASLFIWKYTSLVS